MTDFVARLPQERADDVVVLDPTNPCPVGFNPLAGPPELAVVTAEAVLGVLAELFRDSWGIRTADVLSAALLTLARIPQATLVWLVPLLTNPAFRRRVLALAPPDPLGTDVFWQGYEAKPVRTQAVEVAPVLNKLRQLMLRPGLRAMLGQAQPRFGLADLLERRRIVVVNLNQGLLGAGAARLLGTLLVAQLWQHLLARQAEPVQRRQIVSVYIDEVQAFLAGLPGSLADALAQARSLGAAFHLAHQYRGQLSGEMMQAVESNTRSKVYFALSATDAAAAARLAPELEAADFQLLAQYQAYATVMHQGRRSGWFSLATRPAPPAVRDPALLYAASHGRYGIPAEQTEAELSAADRTQIEHYLHDELAQIEGDKAKAVRSLTTRRTNIEDRRRRLLHAHYEGAVPLDLLKEEQAKLTSELSQIERQLAAYKADAAEVRQHLTQALDLLEDCHRLYTAAPAHLKKLLNQVFFERVLVNPLVDEDGRIVLPGAGDGTSDAVNAGGPVDKDAAGEETGVEDSAREEGTGDDSGGGVTPHSVDLADTGSGTRLSALLTPPFDQLTSPSLHTAAHAHYLQHLAQPDKPTTPPTADDTLMSSTTRTTPTLVGERCSSSGTASQPVSTGEGLGKSWLVPPAGLEPARP